MEKDGIEAIRGEIDALDAEIHARLMRRMDRMTALGEKKRASGEKSAYRPEREAALFRARIRDHRGPMALESLLRIWQEICAAAAQIQMRKVLEAALFAPAETPRFLDIARAQCGAGGTIRLLESAEETLKAAKADPSLLAMLPAPTSLLPKEGRRWWRLLTPPLQIVARLPFLSGGEDGAALYVVMRREWRASGDDITLLRAKDDKDAPAQNLRDGSLVGEILCREEGQTLLALDGHIAKGDDRLSALARRMGALVYLGGFAKPLAVKRS